MRIAGLHAEDTVLQKLISSIKALSDVLILPCPAGEVAAYICKLLRRYAWAFAPHRAVRSSAVHHVCNWMKSCQVMTVMTVTIHERSVQARVPVA